MSMKLNSQYEPQEKVGDNLNLPDGVDGRLAGFAPEIDWVKAARNRSVLICDDYSLPPPEPSVADRESDAWDTEGPYQEVETNIPGWMIWTAAPRSEENEEGDRVIDQRDEDLLTIMTVSYGSWMRKTQ